MRRTVPERASEHASLREQPQVVAGDVCHRAVDEQPVALEVLRATGSTEPHLVAALAERRGEAEGVLIRASREVRTC